MDGDEDRKGKIMLVDDDPTTRMAMSIMLGNEGFVVYDAESPHEALNSFEGESFDAIISDINMKPIDGFAFRDIIRRRNAEVPVIFLTSRQNDEDNRLLQDINNDFYSHYVPKSPNATFLKNKLRQVIRYYRYQMKVEKLEARMERNLELASIVQFSMLPPWVRFEANYEFSCFYKPLGKVSGDLFDWIQIDESRCLAIFGDISGHDTAAALGMTAVQSFVSQIVTTYKEELGFQPHKIVQELEDFIIRHLAPAVYMCGIVIFWDFENNIVSFHNAGHKDIIAYDTAKREFVNLNPEKKGSMAMGMTPGTKHLAEENVTCHFSDETIFLIASDGLGDLSKDSGGNNYIDDNQRQLNGLIEILALQSVKEDNTVSMPYRLYDALGQVGYSYPQDDCLLFMLRKPSHMNREKIFVCRLSPNNVAVDNVGDEASKFILEKTSDVVLAEEAELLIEEHMNNIVKHGLSSYKRENDYIVLKVAFIPDALKVTIWDRGTQMPNVQTGGLLNPDAQLDLVNEMQLGSGRGLSIISKIASEINRQRFSGLNETVFTIPYKSGSRYEEM